ncbi:MAG: DMT family transporter [Rhodospirillales bacterium]|nr:DMT family transporter [Rhodospirillales bacterium]
MSERAKGLLLMIGAGLAWSTGGIFVRYAPTTPAWEIVFWRSFFMVLFLGAVLLVWHRGRAMSKIAAVGRPGVLAGFFLSLTFFFFILSITRTTAANTLIIMSTAPFVAALFGRLFVGERVASRTWAAMIVALAGIAVMFADSFGSGGTLGNLLAFGVPLAYASNLTMLRRARARARADMVPTVLIAGLISLAVSLPMAWPFAAPADEIAVLAAMDFFQLGFGCLLMTLAVRHLIAAEIGLFTLLETTLGPIWVWLGVGERPGDLALGGGIVVVGALAVNEYVGWRQARRRPATT